MASTVQPAKAAIFAIVAAAVEAATPGVQVTYGNAGARMEPETVWIDNAQFDDEAVSIGQVSHRESYRVPVVVSVIHQGDPGNGQPADERLHAIFGPIEDAFRTLPPGPNINVANVDGCWISGKAFDTYLGEGGGTVVEATLSIQVRSRY